MTNTVIIYGELVGLKRTEYSKLYSSILFPRKLHIRWFRYGNAVAKSCTDCIHIVKYCGLLNTNNPVPFLRSSKM